MVSEKALKEYKKIYKEEFGKDISDKDALEQAINLLTLMDAIYRPITKKDLEMLEERDLDKKSQKIKLSSGKEVRIAKLPISFKKWQGDPVRNNYGGKAIIDYNGEPLFAELVVLRELQRCGLKGVWVDSYRKTFRSGMPDIAKPAILSKKQAELFNKISDKVGKFKGCWDIFVWKGNKYLFAELKRKSKDRIRESQVKWLEESLKLGIPETSFVIVEWDIK